MTKRQAYQQTLEKWEWIAEHNGDVWADVGAGIVGGAPDCGFCQRVNDICGNCQLVEATGKECCEFRLWINWDRAHHILDWDNFGEAVKWARHIVAYLKRLGKREEWDK